MAGSLLAPLAAALVVLIPAPASAYIDPGAGNVFIQVVVALVVGTAAALRYYWKRLGEFVGRLSGRAKRGPGG